MSSIELITDPSQLTDGADARLEISNKAACALWWSDVPTVSGQTLGTLGAYHATGGESSKRLLAEAETILREHGCTMAVGPMDGNTWRHYRFVTDAGTLPPFFLEPHNPMEWPTYFQNSGWESLATYSSSRLALEQPTADRSRLLKRLDNAGVVIRPLNMNDFTGELARIYEVCAASFADNFLYTPLSREAFVAMYARIKPVTVADFVQVAECEGVPIGFVFAIPDRDKTLIVKTLAVLPERRVAGLGTLLVERVQEAASAAGFTRAIHALQYESNTSLRITSRHGAERIREYTLFHKHLGND
jgi:GNAT superfamily N-acetyltransferase